MFWQCLDALRSEKSIFTYCRVLLFRLVDNKRNFDNSPTIWLKSHPDTSALVALYCKHSRKVSLFLRRSTFQELIAKSLSYYRFWDTLADRRRAVYCTVRVWLMSENHLYLTHAHGFILNNYKCTDLGFSFRGTSRSLISLENSERHPGAWVCSVCHSRM